MKRNGTIDLMRFIFSVLIILYHGGRLIESICKYRVLSGYIGVEFFFIVSGYLLSAKALQVVQNKEGTIRQVYTANIQYFFHRIISLFPFVFLASLTSIFLLFLSTLKWEDLAHSLAYSISDIMGLQLLGFSGYYSIGTTWYLSVLFLLSFLLYPVLIQKRESFTKYFAPFFALFLMGYLCYSTGYLDEPNVLVWGFVFKGVLRGLADMCLGVVAFEISAYLRQDSVRTNSVVLSAVELFGYLSTIIYALFSKGRSVTDFFFPFLLTLSISISFSQKSRIYQACQHPICTKLGALTLSLFLNHFYIYRFLYNLDLDLKPIIQYGIYVVSALILSSLNYLVGKKLAKKITSPQSIVKVLIGLLIAAQIVWGSQALVSHINSSSATVYQKEEMNNLKILEATFDESSVAAGEMIGAVIITGKDAEILSIFTENNTIIKTWDATAFSTETDENRIWNVEISFNGVGDRVFTFKAGNNEEIYGEEVKVSIKVIKQ